MRLRVFLGKDAKQILIIENVTFVTYYDSKHTLEYEAGGRTFRITTFVGYTMETM